MHRENGRNTVKIMNVKTTSDQRSKAGRVGGKVGGKINGPKNILICNAKLTREQRQTGGKIAGSVNGKRMSTMRWICVTCAVT